jgi:hypothetical protein
MGRRRKRDDEKMRQLWVHLPPEVVATIERVAERRSEHVSEVLRVLVLAGFQTLKTKSPDSSLTL